MTNTSPLYLCLDQGGSSSRALVFDGAGHCLASAQRLVDTERPHPGWVEQNPEAVVASLLDAANAALSQLSATDRQRLHSAGLATQRSSMLCWERDSGNPLTPIISWQDVRAADWLTAQHWPIADIHQRTGLMANAHFGVSKMRWCLDHVAEVKQSADSDNLVMGSLASFLIMGLTNTQAPRVDPANASRTLLMNLAQLDWDADLLHRAGIQRQWLPAICPTVHHFGDINLSGCRIPFHLVNGDQSSAAFALGLPKPRSRYLNVGTGAFVFQPVNEPVANTTLLSSVIYSGTGTRYVLEGTVNGAGSAINQFATDRGISDLPSAIEDALALDNPPMIFLNGVGGLGSPDWRADFPSRFIGQGGDKEQLRAIVESILFLLMRNMAAMDAAGLQADELIVSGGVSASDGFCQLLSDLSGLTVERSANPEATARGTAFLLAGMPERWEVLPSARFTPTPNDRLKERFADWSCTMASKV
jgi:glycerol kinase